ncbi:hypothetical protein HK104_011107 [Borealophlyctis nickersoniae]|nr:hypothetical protein HK104_011107 [Borealophlyctis nickersoniae]
MTVPQAEPTTIHLFHLNIHNYTFPDDAKMTSPKTYITCTQIYDRPRGVPFRVGMSRGVRGTPCSAYTIRRCPEDECPVWGWCENDAHILCCECEKNVDGCEDCRAARRKELEALARKWAEDWEERRRNTWWRRVARCGKEVLGEVVRRRGGGFVMMTKSGVV